MSSNHNMPTEPIPVIDESPQSEGISRRRFNVEILLGGLGFGALGAMATEEGMIIYDRYFSDDTPSGNTPEVRTEEAVTGLRDPAKKHLARQITSTFEYSTTEIPYDRAQNINDGRGITAGPDGFTSGTGDLLLVVHRYSVLRPNTPLSKYEPALKKITQSVAPGEMTDDVTGLNGFIETWGETSRTDPVLNQVQDVVSDELYFDPAMKRCEDTGIKTAIGQEIIWDAIIQHGEGEDKDGLPAMMKEVTDRIGVVNGNEVAWLHAFLDVRAEHLKNAAEEKTREGWLAAVSRVDALRSILDSGNLELDLSKGPISWTVYGDSFTLKQS